MKEDKKIIVIGSGFGGMASALRMRAKGYGVTLLEKHPDLGGRARVFKKDGFTYDGGPTVITAPYLLEELFSLFNKKISDYTKIVPLDLWYRFVFEDNSSFDYSGNEKDMEKEIQKFSRNDFEGYKKLVNFTEKIFDKGFTELSAKPFNSWIKDIENATWKSTINYPTVTTYEHSTEVDENGNAKIMDYTIFWEEENLRWVSWKDESNKFYWNPDDSTWNAI